MLQFSCIAMLFLGDCVVLLRIEDQIVVVYKVTDSDWDFCKEKCS